MALDLIFDVLLKSHPAVNTPIKETIQESSQEPVEGSEEKAGAKRRKASVPKVSDWIVVLFYQECFCVKTVLPSFYFDTSQWFTVVTALPLLL